MGSNSLYDKLFGWFPALWNKQLYIIENQPITIGQVLVAAVLFILGYFICRTVSREFGKRVLTRLDIDNSLRHTLQTFVFYILLIILILFVMSLLNIPLTAFTVLGGALAIGVGFGSQNVVNNFISGLIMMVERPVRVGDFIQQGDLQGRVEHIGARSTMIRSMDNTHIIVPNSTFLETNVTNWTLSDDLIRTKVTVGVAYGSETRKVKDLLKQAAQEEELILKYPEPIVVFDDFADSALVFHVYFWTRLKDMLQLKILASSVRFRIDDVFRENGVVIAFPQQDVHLDSLKPIQVEMIKSPST